MSVCLTAWLEETFETQLLLAHDWLRQRCEQKDAQWKDLYHDNGSCIDITNDIDPEHPKYLHIVKLSPLLLCDSRFLVRAQLPAQSLAHLHDLVHRHLYTTISVQKYSIRYTSYGPSRDKLQLILHTVACLPQIERVDLQVLKPLWSENIATHTGHLDQLRRKIDSRCLGAVNTLDLDEAVMAASDDPFVGESQPLTQHPFGTQVPHAIQTPAIRARKHGNAQTDTSRPARDPPRMDAGGAPKSKQDQLLGLLGRCGMAADSNPAPAVGKDDQRTKVQGTQSTNPQTAVQPFTQLPAVVDHRPTQYPTAIRAPSRSPKQHSPPQRTHLDNEGPNANPLHASRSEPERRQEQPVQGTSKLQELAAGCSWMKDFDFTREAFRVNNRQLSLLQRDESWHRPPPGRTFPQGNIPIEILNMIHRLADESAASGAAPDSDDDMDEDPSPESILGTINPTPASAAETTHIEPTPSSPVSWSSTPEPPQVPSRPNQELPPDSSFEIRNLAIDDNAPQGEPEKSPVASGSTEFQAHAQISSSPPALHVVDSDDEMEMEAYIPQGLGEDATSSLEKPDASLPVVRSPEVKAVVQVKETPYPKSKVNQASVHPSSSTRKQVSSGSTKTHSSTSIIYGTYDDARPISDRQDPLQMKAAAQGDGEGRRDAQIAIIQVEQPVRRVVESHLEGPHLRHSSSPLRSPQDPGRDASAPRKHVLEAEMSTDLHSPRIAAKRKLVKSPSKKSSRHVKRREIKIVGFGDDMPSSIEPAIALRQQREQSLQDFREQRDATRNLKEPRETTPLSAGLQNEDSAMADVAKAEPNICKDSAMSPRHRSLYEESDSDNAIRKLNQEEQSPPAATLEYSTIRGGAKTSTDPIRTPPVEQSPTSYAVAITANTVFESFKAAYPEYTGDAKHFAGQCLQINALEAEDRMVPKWQWDDYIIRSRTDFKDYALKCLNSGEDAGDYIRYYKDHIRHPIYQKDIVADKQTLARALKELEVAVPEGQKRVEKPKERFIPSVKKKSRTSLPSAFINHKRTSSHNNMDTDRKRPRVSLPTNTQTRHSTSSTTYGTTSKTHTSASEASARRGSSLKSTPPRNEQSSKSPDRDSEDPFQDFYYAWQRTTSSTGSKDFDAKKPWPQNLAVRPSIGDMPKRKTDVLKWKDEL